MKENGIVPPSVDILNDPQRPYRTDFITYPGSCILIDKTFLIIPGTFDAPNRRKILFQGDAGLPIVRSDIANAEERSEFVTGIVSGKLVLKCRDGASNNPIFVFIGEDRRYRVAAFNLRETPDIVAISISSADPFVEIRETTEEDAQKLLREEAFLRRYSDARDINLENHI